MQINPPFNGSAPCAACQDEVRSFMATLHNVYNRWDSSSRLRKLRDIQLYNSKPLEFTVESPINVKMKAVHDALRSILSSTMTEDQQMIRITPEGIIKLDALGPDVKELLIEFDPISEAHFEDDRHSSGRENILRSRQGSKSTLWGTRSDTGYNYTVEVSPSSGDIKHQVCGTRLELHEYFKAHLRKDPEFYAKVYCPTCRLAAPSEQFEFCSTLGEG